MTCIHIAGTDVVGGYLGVKPALTDQPVNVLAHGAALQALQVEELRLTEDGNTRSVPVHMSDNARAFGVQSVVIVTIKAPAIENVVQGIAPLIGSETCVVVATNGMLWWFFDRREPLKGLCLRSVDPYGRTAQAIPTKNILGYVVHLVCSTAVSGHIRHGFGKRLTLGKPAGGISPRLGALGALFERAGLQVERNEAIQRNIWFRLWGSMVMNPVSVPTGMTCDRILDDPLISAFCLGVMEEAKTTGARTGCLVEQSGEECSAVARQLNAFKASMLQDAEAGRGLLGIDALVASVREIGQHAGVSTPQIDTLLGLVRLHAQIRGLY